MIESTANNVAIELLDFINNSPTMYNAVSYSEEYLNKNGFTKLETGKKWEIEVNGRYYVNINSSGIVAFVVNGNEIAEEGFRIIGSHTDSPTFRIKPNPEIKINGQIKLNVEPYGGMIISSWFDRPLAIAGRVLIRNWKSAFKPEEKIVNINRPICIIPSLAIHMNREINSGYEYNKQNDVMPLILETGEELDNEEYIKNLLIRELEKDRNYVSRERDFLIDDEPLEYANVRSIRERMRAEDEKALEPDDILDYELYLYEYERGSLVGENQEFISAGRLDNLASMHSSLKALVDSENSREVGKRASDELRRAITEITSSEGALSRDYGIYDSSVNNTLLREYHGFRGINMVVAFNNEEVGSMSKEGADSETLGNIIERICLSLGKTREDMLIGLENSFMISADLAHAVHPNKAEKADLTNKPLFGKGPAIKIHAGKAYASDSYSVAVYKEICRRNKVDYQCFVNRSDMRSGSTIGSIIASHLPMPIVDVGIPLLAMHSARELANVDDYFGYYKSMLEFLSAK